MLLTLKVQLSIMFCFVLHKDSKFPNNSWIGKPWRVETVSPNLTTNITRCGWMKLNSMFGCKFDILINYLLELNIELSFTQPHRHKRGSSLNMSTNPNVALRQKSFNELKSDIFSCQKLFGFHINLIHNLSELIFG